MLTTYIGFRNVIILATALIFGGGCDSVDMQGEETLDEKVSEFVINLLSRNEVFIVENYLESSPSFSENNHFTKDVAKFLYESNSESGTSSVLDIVTENNFAIKILWQSEIIFTAIVVSRDNFKELNDLNFLQHEWMRKYFACEFIVKDDAVLLYQNVCFAETGGPFPLDDDI